MDNSSFQSNITSLKNQCIQYEQKTLETLKNTNDYIAEIDSNIIQVKEKNNTLTADIAQLENEYKDLLKKCETNHSNDEFNEEKMKLDDSLKRENDLLNQLNYLQNRCDNMNDEEEMKKKVMYWYPNTMFQYTQEYVKQLNNSN